MYDLIVIGAGIAGYEAAAIAGNNNIKALLIEKSELGGTCLNCGCIPSKLYLNVAKELLHIQRDNELGILSGKVAINMDNLIKQKNKIIHILQNGIRSKLMESKVEIIKGKAEIEKKEGDCFKVMANGCQYKAARLIIATGSRVFIPPIEGVTESLKNGFALTDKNIFDLKEIPNSLVIVGGGVSGIEMAVFFKSVGCEVTVIEAKSNILDSFDKEISKKITEGLEKKGIRFKLNSIVTEINDGYVAYKENLVEDIIECDKVYCCMGRQANLDIKGLDNLDINIEQNFIATDIYGRTNVKNVYAVGDVNGKSMLAHSAVNDAKICMDAIIGKATNEKRANIIPHVVYIHPELAAVGENEETARKKGLKYKSVTLSMAYSGRYIAECRNSNTDGMIKLLIGEDEKLIGASIISNYASELIILLGEFIKRKVSINEIEQYIFPHPTECEIVQNCIEKFKRNR